MNEHARNQLLAWLQRDDQNGTYTDENCDAEGVPRINDEQLIAHVAYALNLGDYEEFLDDVDPQDARNHE